MTAFTLLRRSQGAAIIMLLLAALFIHVTCKSKAMNKTTVSNKLDAPLRVKLQDAERAQADTLLQCLVEVKGQYDEQIKQQLEAAGLRVSTVVNAIATAEGTPEAIRRAASFDFVRRISLSQTRKPLQKR
jgi:hypothetical protein